MYAFKKFTLIITLDVIMCIKILISMPSGPWFIESLANCDYLDACNLCPGSKVFTNQFSGENSQKWKVKTEFDNFLIVNDWNGLVLDIDMRASPPNLTLWPVANSCNQRWKFIGNINKAAIIHSGMCNYVVDVCGAKVGQRSLVGVWHRQDSINQKFKFSPA